MIKINKFLYIHFTTILLFAVGYINRNLEMIFLSYLVILLHEISHLIAALCIGLKMSHIVLFPFGVNLKLKNSIVYSITDEIILYMSGPLFNILAALVCCFMRKRDIYWEMFYFNNISLFLFNLLPILPMDGGVVLKKILERKLGVFLAEKIIKGTSIFFISVLILAQIYLLITCNFNFSILLAVIFLTGNIFTNKEKYHIEFTKELLFYKKKDEKEIKRVKSYLIKENTEYKKLVRHFAQGSHYVIFKEDEHGRISGIMTEREVIDKMLKIKDRTL